MGTVVSLDLRGAGDHDAAIDALVRWFHEVDERFSPFRSGSETCRYGRGELSVRDSPDLAEVVAACAAVGASSDGAFAAWRDGRFDPSAYVKGWSVDRAAMLLAVHGCEHWSVNAGGDVLTRGEAAPGRAWRVGVRDPADPARVVAVVAGEAAVATSGSYERGAHIAARAGAPLSVTVVGPTLGLADAVSTAAFALGDHGAAWLGGLPGFEGLVIRTDGTATATAGFPRTVHGIPVAPHAAEVSAA